MKRSSLGPGPKALERGSTFANPRSELPRSEIKRKPRPYIERRRAAAADRRRGEAWATRARSKPCAVCGSQQVEGHHVITKQQLRRWASAEGFDIERILWDLRNCLSLCERHHAAHHSWARRLTLSFVLEHCPKLHQFASELGLMWWLEREYPETGS